MDMIVLLLIIVLLFFVLAAIAVGIVSCVAFWKVYKKAGKGGWEILVPFYCNWVLVEISGLHWWWFLFFFVPLLGSLINFILMICLNVVMSLNLSDTSLITNVVTLISYLVYFFAVFNCFYNISKRFNKGIGFAICLTLFTPITICVLGFSKNTLYNSSVMVSANGVFGTPNRNVNNTNNNQNNTLVISTDNVEKNDELKKNEDSSTNNVEHAIPNVVYCGNCGTKLNKYTKFCPNCGNEKL